MKTDLEHAKSILLSFLAEIDEMEEIRRSISTALPRMGVLVGYAD